MFDEITLQNVLSAKDKLTYRNQAFINGAYVDSIDKGKFNCVSAATGETLTQIAQCNEKDVDSAVSAARISFTEGHWSGLEPAQRKRILIRFADLLEENRNELGLLECLDVGKPITEAINTDVTVAADAIRWTAEAIDKLNDEVVPAGPKVVATITHEPLGVIAAVVPWNYSLFMAAWKIGPILATGNSLILKPAEQSPLTAIRIAELANAAGIPKGVFNVLPGYGETVGKALGCHADVDGVAFTGSTRVGKLFLKYAAESNMKRVSVECGGKSPIIIMPDADLDAAAETAVWGLFYNQGESCDALTRTLIHESVKDEVLSKILSIAKEIKIGNPLDPDTESGAIIDQTQFDQIMAYIELAQQEGAKLVLGGNSIDLDSNALVIEPTFFDEVDNSMRIAQEEVFGPVGTVLTFKDVDEAIAIANDSKYGLVSSVWTNDLNTAYQFRNHIRAGSVWINCHDAGDMTVPFGGFGESGIGRDRSLHSLHKYCELKTTWINLA